MIFSNKLFSSKFPLNKKILLKIEKYYSKIFITYIINQNKFIININSLCIELPDCNIKIFDNYYTTDGKIYFKFLNYLFIIKPNIITNIESIVKFELISFNKINMYCNTTNGNVFISGYTSR